MFVFVFASVIVISCQIIADVVPFPKIYDNLIPSWKDDGGRINGASPPYVFRADDQPTLTGPVEQSGFSLELLLESGRQRFAIVTFKAFSSFCYRCDIYPDCCTLRIEFGR